MARHGTPSRPVAANLHRMSRGKNVLDLRAIADRCGLTYSTVQGYHTLAKRRRREGTSRRGDLPEPDDHIGGHPMWYVETIEKWEKERPGQGAGGGRPRTNRKEDRR